MKKYLLSGNLKSQLIKRHRGTDHATILRGLAACSVMLVHANGFGLRDSFDQKSTLDQSINFFINLGVYGPTVFFVASGFALSASLATRKANYFAYLMQRTFRLLPLYAFILIFTFAQFEISGQGDFEVKNLISKVLFLDILSKKYFYDDPVGVLSTVPIEFWWSAFVPILFVIRRKGAKVLEALLVITLFWLALFDEFTQAIPIFSALSESKFLIYGICFYLGNVAWLIRTSKFTKSTQLLTAFSLTSVVMVIHFSNFSSFLEVSLISAGFLVYAQNDRLQKKSALLNDFLIFLGTICYSIYLWHNPILKLIFHFELNSLASAVLAIPLILIVATFSYLLIEVPGIKLGKKFSERLRRNA
jgi:peptidoglycan/LPS O-acetylase OafA/YrhL